MIGYEYLFVVFTGCLRRGFFFIAVVTNILPNTGISLPFISYGGSSVVCLLAEMGFVMSVCRRMDFTQEDDIVPQKAPERADRGAEE